MAEHDFNKNMPRETRQFCSVPSIPTSYQHSRGTSLDGRTSQVKLVENYQVPQEITGLDDTTSQEESVKNYPVPQGTSLDPGTSQQESVIDLGGTQTYKSKFSICFLLLMHSHHK
jgi:hypothetical protein